MEVKEQGGFALKGHVVQIGNPTKSGGRFVTVTTGQDLVKVFFGKDQVGTIPRLMEYAKFALGMPSDGFITAK